MNNIKEHVIFLDLLRIIACFFVIVNHTNSQIFLGVTPEHTVWFISVTYFFISKVAVPIFFMISGYLLLGKTDSWKKTFKRISRIVLTLLCSAVVYGIYNELMSGVDFSALSLLRRICLVYTVHPTGALWYLYAYLGLLLMMPFLQKMNSLMEKKDYYIFFVVSGTFFGVIPILVHYIPAISYSNDFQIPLYTSYICMLFIGQYFAKYGIEKTKRRLCLAVLVFFVMILFNVGATYFEFYISSEGYLFFDNRSYFPIVTASICVFYIASCIRFSEKIAKPVSHIGSCTFGIYLMSDLLIATERPIYRFLQNIMHPIFAVIIFEVLIFITGTLITIVLKKIPVIRTLL